MVVSTKCKIKFIPNNVEITVDQGTNLRSAAIAAGIPMISSCGGTGVCGKCKVQIKDGIAADLSPMRLSENEYSSGLRLACQTVALTDLNVFVPVESRLEEAVQANVNPVSRNVPDCDMKHNPPIKKYYLDLSTNAPKNISDLFRLRCGLDKNYNLGDAEIDLGVIQKLARSMREQDGKITVTALIIQDNPVSKNGFSKHIINIEPGDTSQNCYALAIDIGTTTVCSQILDLNQRKILADAVVFNKQKEFGDDVISRINYCQRPGGLKKLQEAVINSINETIDDLLNSSGIKREDINHISVAGNTTMQHILYEINPQYIRLTPYTPTVVFMPLVKAGMLGIDVADHVYVYSFPSPASWVGGDIVSGVMAAGIHRQKKLTCYIDLGTNGEIAIGNSEWMMTASCSAGPAFEGGGIKFGMVAMKGAIQDVSIDPISFEPAIKTIGNSKPKGICGSGLINTIAGLLETGVIGQNGKFNTQIVSSRIRPGSDNYEYVLAWAFETQIGQDIVISEIDIDNLIRAKAAMYAGCHTLANCANITFTDFEQIILAGNFGSSINIEKAITIGLLPDVPRDRFAFIGNGSLSGARLINCSADYLEDAQKIAHTMTNIELSEDKDFIDKYMAALFLPHTDMDAFPSISRKINRNNDNVTGVEN